MSQRDPMAPIIQGDSSLDCSGLVNRYSMRYETVEREGDNAGLLRDGKQVKDVLARKLRLSWTLNSMSASRYAELARMLARNELYATVFDPLRNGNRLIQCVATLPAFEVAFVADGEAMSKADAVLILEEV